MDQTDLVYDEIGAKILTVLQKQYSKDKTTDKATRAAEIKIDSTQNYLKKFRGQTGVLHILHHARRGGTEKYARQLASSISDMRHYLLITNRNEWILEDVNDKKPRLFLFFSDDKVKLLASLCTWLAVNLVHVHHILGDRDNLLKSLDQLKMPYGITVHDFFLACPTINLIGANNRYCHSETDHKACQNCLDQQPEYRDINISSWRQNNKKLVKNSGFVIAPSVNTAQIFKKYFPETDIEIVPHGAQSLKVSTKPSRVFLFPDDGIPTIGILGAMSTAKGQQRLQSLIARTEERKLLLRWIHIGYTDEHLAPYQTPDRCFTVHGPYESSQIEQLLDHYKVRLVVFLALWPETFCYTLTEAWQADRLVLVPPIGALQERVIKTGAGWVMDNFNDDDEILDQIIRLVHSNASDDVQKKTQALRNIALPSTTKTANQTSDLYNTISKTNACLNPLPSKTIFNAALAMETRLRSYEIPVIEINHPIVPFLHSSVGIRLRKLIPYKIRRWARQLLFGV